MSKPHDGPHVWQEVKPAAEGSVLKEGEVLVICTRPGCGASRVTKPTRLIEKAAGRRTLFD